MTKTPPKHIAFIGFGEAGGCFAEGLLGNGVEKITCYDILLDKNSTAGPIREKAEKLGVQCRNTPEEAVKDADVVISVVTSHQTAVAAKNTARGLRAGQVYLDLNSCSPAKKLEAAKSVEGAGASFVEGVAMDTIVNFGHNVPVIASGPKAAAVAEALNAARMDVTAVGEEFGQAAAIKMMRSVMLKGLESLFVECVLGAGRYGVTDHVFDSLQVTFPGTDWRKVAGYHLGRVAQHGLRRSHEMESVADTLRAVDVEPVMSSGSAKVLKWCAELDLMSEFPDGAPETIEAFVAAAEKKLAARNDAAE